MKLLDAGIWGPIYEESDTGREFVTGYWHALYATGIDVSGTLIGYPAVLTEQAVRRELEGPTQFTVTAYGAGRQKQPSNRNR